MNYIQTGTFTLYILLHIGYLYIKNILSLEFDPLWVKYTMNEFDIYFVYRQIIA